MQSTHGSFLYQYTVLCMGGWLSLSEPGTAKVGSVCLVRHPPMVFHHTPNFLHVYINPHMPHTTTWNEWETYHATKGALLLSPDAWVLQLPPSQVYFHQKSIPCWMLFLALGRDAACQLVWSMHACMPISLLRDPSRKLIVSLFLPAQDPTAHQPWHQRPLMLWAGTRQLSRELRQDYCKQTANTPREQAPRAQYCAQSIVAASLCSYSTGSKPTPLSDYSIYLPMGCCVPLTPHSQTLSLAPFSMPAHMSCNHTCPAYAHHVTHPVPSLHSSCDIVHAQLTCWLPMSTLDVR